MHDKSKITAEEILSEENFSEELIEQKAKDEVIDEKEIRIARSIYSFLNEPSGSVTWSDKEKTKNQIRSSVRKLSIKRQMIRWSVAASILLAALITSVGFLRINSRNDIVSFAQSQTKIKAENNTRIILQNGEEITIDKAQSQIRYDAKGENIEIDSDQKIVQEIADEKAVFNTVIVPHGKRTQIILSEGTKVWLNSGSKLVYPAVFAKNKREVYLDGEAVFDVAHLNDRSFVVSTKDFDIKVLGTIFNVCAYSDDQNSNAVLEQGKIELINRRSSVLSNKHLMILPGTMAVFDPNQNTFEKQQVNPRKYLSWREGYLIFNSEKLQNIIRKLGRYYNKEMVIIDNQLKDETFSGYLDLKNSPEEVLSVINETTPLSFSVDHEKIVINSK